VEITAAALVGVGWLSPWRAPAEPAGPVAVDPLARVAVTAPLASAPAPATARASKPAPKPARAARPSRTATKPRADVWRALAQCESGGNPIAVSADGRYFGAFQFELSSWQLVGMTGNPVDHPYDVQLEAARRLQSVQGWGAWPTCARQLGLLA
jgi:hypothetical protein